MYIVTKLKEYKFLRQVSIVMSGTIFAQLLTLLTAPILSRLFSPSDFGLFAFYTSVISILSVIITFRYELSIVIPDNEKDSISLLFLSIFFSVINALIIFVILLLTRSFLLKFENAGNFNGFCFFIPVALLFIGIFNSFKYWNIKKGDFKITSYSNVSDSFTTSIIQVSLGLLTSSFYGLIVGKLSGQFIGSIMMILQVLKEDIIKLKSNFCLKRMKFNLRQYKDFPKYGMPQALFSSLSMNIVPILLLFFFSNSLVGYYALALRVLQMPINLIGNAFKDVFYQRSALLINQHGDLKRLYNRSVISLALFFIPFILLIFFFSKEIFVVIFGEEWSRTGEVARWMILWMYTIIISRPAIVLMQVLKKQKSYLKLEVLGFILKTVIFVVISIIFKNYTITIAIYSISNIIHYFMIMLLVNKYISMYQASLSK